MNFTAEIRLFVMATLLASVVPPGFAQQEYQRWLEKQQLETQVYIQNETKKYQRFQDKRDSTFVEFLKSEWKATALLSGDRPNKMPKPASIPAVEPRPLPEEAMLEQGKIVGDIRLPEPPMRKTAHSIATLLRNHEDQPLVFSFISDTFTVHIDKALLNARIGKAVEEKEISAFWAHLSQANYTRLLQQMQDLRDQMRLNDWGYCLMLYRIGEKLYAYDRNRTLLFVWYMLAKSDYDAKVGFSSTGIFLFLPAKNVIYDTPYFFMDNKRYFLIAFDQPIHQPASIYTYTGCYPEAQVPISLTLTAPPEISNSTEVRKLVFKYHNRNYTVELKLIKDVIEFFSRYPLTDLDVYFKAPLSSEAQTSLVGGLKPILEGKSEVEAVNILLRFVQTAFRYNNDETQFGREKPLFAEETLYYPSSDCEDRAVLFAYLVQNLLGLPVVGLNYPGHIANAVKISTTLAGDSIIYNGEKYLICDATYINANIGQCMPALKDRVPQVITFKTN